MGIITRSIFGFALLFVSLFAFSASAQEVTGTLDFNVYSCPEDQFPEPAIYIADPVTGESFPSGEYEGCMAANSTFTMTNENGTATSTDTGVSASVQLPVGLYTVTNDATGLSRQVNIVEGQASGVMLVTVAAGEEPAEETGVVSIWAQMCPALDDVWVADGVNGDGIPDVNDDPEGFYEGCVDTATTLNFVMDGDIVATVNTADTEGAIELPVGEYVVEDQATGATATVNILADVPAEVYARHYDGSELVEEVYLRAHECPMNELGEPTLYLIEPGTTGPEGEGAYDGCVDISTSFTFVDESGVSTTVDVSEEVVVLPVGLYTVADELTGLSGELNVLSGSPSTVYLRIPLEGDDTEEPAPTEAVDNEATATPGVTQLPSTGSGEAGQLPGTMGTLLMLSGVGILLVLGSVKLAHRR